MTRIGIVGTGAISGIYIENLKKFRETEIVAVADLDLDRARAKAEAEGIPNACTTEELLARDDIDLVLNLTVPKAQPAKPKSVKIPISGGTASGNGEQAQLGALSQKK